MSGAESRYTSASVPGVYSPVLINVEGDGRRFEEMHVDGGVRANLLVVPESLLLSSVPPPAGFECDAPSRATRNMVP